MQMKGVQIKCMQSKRMQRKCMQMKGVQIKCMQSKRMQRKCMQMKCMQRKYDSPGFWQL